MKKIIFIFIGLFVILTLYLKFSKIEEYSIIKKDIDEIDKYIDNNNYINFINAYKFSCKTLIDLNKDINTFFFEIKAKNIVDSCGNISTINDKNSFINWLKSNFSLYQIKNNIDNSKFTSYVQATIDVSLKKNSEYKFPIYSFPKDMVVIDISTFSDVNIQNKKNIFGRIAKSGHIVSYFPSKYIYNNKIKSNPIAFAKTRTDVLYLQTQGSGVLNANGEKILVRYAANNGFAYKSVLKKLIQDKQLKNDYSWEGMRKWEIESSDDVVKKYLNYNERYIFFNKEKLKKNNDNFEPVGTFGYNLIPQHSIAVDNKYIPLGFGMILNIEKSKYNDTINKFVFSHDTGGAIKGGVRGDFYYGTGKDAYEKAKKYNNKGHYSILIPKNSIIREHTDE